VRKLEQRSRVAEHRINAHRRALVSDLPTHRRWCWQHPDEHGRRGLHRAPPERCASGATALSWRIRHRTATPAAIEASKETVDAKGLVCPRKHRSETEISRHALGWHACAPIPQRSPRRPQDHRPAPTAAISVAKAGAHNAPSTVASTRPLGGSATRRDGRSDAAPAAQHGQKCLPPWQCPSCASCASSGRAWWLWVACTPRKK
jgi:hypothetical protein